LKKYALIYDIPDNPLERISGILEQMKSEQMDVKQRIDSLVATIKNKQTELKNSKDPSKIESLRRTIAELNKTIGEKINQRDANKQLSTELTSLYYAKMLANAQSYYHDLYMQQLDKNKQGRKAKTSNKKIKAEYDLSVSNARVACQRLKESYDLSCDKINMIEHLSSVPWLNYELDVEDMLAKKELPNAFLEKCNNLKSQIEIEKKNIMEDESASKSDVLKGLIDILSAHLDSEMKILDSPLSEVYSKLLEEYQSLRVQKEEFDTMAEIVSSLSKVASDIEGAEAKLKSILPEPVIEEYGTDEELAQKVNKAYEELQRLESVAKKYDVYPEICSSIILTALNNPDVSAYCSYELTKLKEKIGELDSSVSVLNSELEGRNGFNSKLQYNEVKLREMEDYAVNPLIDYQEELNELQTQVGSIGKDMGTKIKIMTDLTNRIEPTSYSENNDFIESVWFELGKRVATIRHIGIEYEVVRVDNLKEEIVTKSGVVISYQDTGTGESQNAYLKSLLNSNSGKIMLAMFDESEHMDPDMVSDVQSRLKELYDDGFLLLGLMASPGKEPEVIPYVG